jgi:hypothetical protein
MAEQEVVVSDLVDTNLVGCLERRVTLVKAVDEQQARRYPCILPDEITA